MAKIRTKHSTISQQDFENPAYMKRQVASSRGRRVNGVSVDRTRNPQQYEILKATESLSKKGYGSQRYTGQDTPNNSAINLLEAMGCSIESSRGKDYSLMNDATDTTIISNPNIVDESRKNKKKNLKSAEGSFPNANDPFYQGDGDIPQQSRLQDDRRRNRKMTPDVMRVAADLAALNMAPQGSTLTEFEEV